MTSDNISNDLSKYNKIFKNSLSKTDNITTNDATTNDATTNDATTNDATTNDATTNDATTNDATTNDATTNDATTNYATTNYATMNYIITNDIEEQNKITSDSEKIISTESENINSNSSSCEEDELQITEYEKKYKLKFKINKKSLDEELGDINTKNLLEIEEEVIKNKYDYILKNISHKKGKLLCNGKCVSKHNYNNIIENLKNSKSFKTSDKCYKNNLYYGLKNNIRGIKTIYNLLLRLIVIYPKYRNKCKCCITDIDKELLKNFETEFKNDKKINNSNILYLNFLINKFLGIISLLPCECKFDKLQTYYTLNYCNYKDYFEIYFKTIPIIILLLKQNHNINKNNKNELSLIKIDRCIHEDIRYYNNFVYCKYNKYEKELTDDININYIINNIEIINEWLKINFKICNLLLNEQNLRLLKFFIKNDELYENNNNIFVKLYKNTNIIDINYILNDENLVQIILNNELKEEIINNLIKFLISKLKEINRTYKNYDINNFLLAYTIQCFTYKKYKYGLDFLTNIENLEDNKIYHHKINNIINELITNREIELNNKVLYFKIINKNKINICNIPILNNLIEVSDGDIILSKFEKSDNIFMVIFTNNNDMFKTIEDIINIIKKCLIYRKPVILDYILYHLDDKIKNINKRNNNIINPYQILFINKENDKNEILYIIFIEVIQKYNYNINININEDFNKNNYEDFNKNKFTYLNLCIKKNYIELGRKLIDYNIIINNNLEGKTIIYHCIDNKNHLIASSILEKDSELGNKLYNGKNIINYLFEKDFEENIKIKFLLIFIKNNFLNINYQDKINQHIGFLILKSNFKKYNKIILFKLICNINNNSEKIINNNSEKIINNNSEKIINNNSEKIINNNSERMKIDPLFKNDKIPLIVYSMLLDEFEITYMLMNKLIDSKKILKTLNDGIFSYYLNNNDKDEINYIPIILKFIRDFDRSKLLDNNIELDIIADQNKCENILVMILKIIYFFIINCDNFTKEQKEIKNKYIKSNKNIVKINYKKSKKYYQNQEEINKYIELSDDDNNNILETDTMQNSNIWKTTTIDTDSESSEIEVSKICFN